MKGDKLVIREWHIKAARQIAELLLPQITETEEPLIVTIAGESGSGKSEVAAAFSQFLSGKKIQSIILQQDDYFVYPPKTNAEIRKKNINHVGPSEVRLDLLDRNLADIVKGKTAIQKPLVVFDEDRVIQETIRLDEIRTVVVEGTYTTLLKNAHQHIFINRTYIDTKETRKERAREKQDDFLEEILKIEHRIISSQKAHADIVVTSNYDVERSKKE